MGEDIGIFVLKNYGFVGAIILGIMAFSAYILKKVLDHFLDSNTEKDKRVVEITNKASVALENNAVATTRLTSAIDNLQHWIQEQAQNNKAEHAEILQFIRKAN